VASTVLSIILLSFEWGYGSQKYKLNRRQKFTDMAFAIFAVLFLGIFHPLLLLLPEEGLLGSWMPFDTMPIWAQILWGIAFHDFLLYWWHRFEHETGDSFLWRLHLGHHAPARLSLLSGARAHTFDLMSLIVALFITRSMGLSNEAMFWVMFHPTALGAFHHCNLDMRLGIFNYVFPGPEFHRAHHRTEIDLALNYASVFPLWDWAFGTLVPSAPADSTVFGVSYINDEKETFGSIHAYPFTGKAPEAAVLENAKQERRIRLKKPVHQPQEIKLKPTPRSQPRQSAKPIREAV
jgi:sterol desaturase/sphingolipid hydroxylase (fatty acid hydroxylase superfamily)